MLDFIFCCETGNQCCEWHKLQPFVEYYNKLNSTSYSLIACLDVEDSTISQPEILLYDANTKQSLVIESKKIHYPLHFFHSHSKSHTLLNTIRKKISSILEFQVGEFSFSEAELEKLPKRKLYQAANTISSIILTCPGSLNQRICSSQPINWSFYTRPPGPVDRGNNELVGIISHPFDFELQEDVLTCFHSELERHLPNIEKKFLNYNYCKRVVVLEFYSSEYVKSEHVLELVKSVLVSHMIDQIWITDKQYINEEDYILTWTLVS